MWRIICLIILAQFNVKKATRTASETERINLAYNKSAYQNSTYSAVRGCPPLEASLAVDGDPNPFVPACHCSHSGDGNGGPNWLVVDLEDFWKLDYVVVYNRQCDNNTTCGQRLDNFYSGLTNTSPQNQAPVIGQYPRCGQFNGSLRIILRGVLKCNSNLPPGRFLIVQKYPGAFDPGAMAVCEFEAYAVENNMIYAVSWKKTYSKRLSKFTVVITSINTSTLSCVHLCTNIPRGCDSFNYNHVLKQCEINQHINGFERSDLVDDLNWSFWTGVHE